MQGNVLLAIYGSAASTCPLFTTLTSLRHAGPHGRGSDVVKFLLGHVKHEAILPKSVVIAEGEMCNRLYVMVNGVLHCAHSKTVSGVRTSHDRGSGGSFHSDDGSFGRLTADGCRDASFVRWSDANRATASRATEARHSAERHSADERPSGASSCDASHASHAPSEGASTKTAEAPQEHFLARQASVLAKKVASCTTLTPYARAARQHGLMGGDTFHLSKAANVGSSSRRAGTSCSRDHTPPSPATRAPSAPPSPPPAGAASVFAMAGVRLCVERRCPLMSPSRPSLPTPPVAFTGEPRRCAHAAFAAATATAGPDGRGAGRRAE